MAQFTDAQINEYVQANIGNPQAIADAAQQYGVSAADLSRATGYDAGTVGNYFSNAGINFGQPVTQAQAVTPPPAAQSMTVNDLYTQVLGRAPDQGGLDYWQGAFGTGNVTADQQASFMQAAQSELANRPVAEQQQLAPNLVNQQASNTAQQQTSNILSPVAVQQQIIADERSRSTDGIASLTSDAPKYDLSGYVLAGDSWLAGDEKTKLANDVFAGNVSNVAVGGQTSADVLNQLNAFESQGGTFAPGTTVVLSVGGNDLMTGVDKNTIRNNINEIVSRLDAQGVKVILSGAPNVGSLSDITSSTTLAMDDLYKDVASANKNTTVVDAMSGFLNDKTTMDESGFHLKDDASKSRFLNMLAGNTSAPTDQQKGLASLTQGKPVDTSETDIQREVGFSSNTAEGMPKPVPLGDGTFKTAGGTIIDKDGRPVVDTNKLVNDLYATIGRTGMGTDASKIDQAGFDYWKQIAGSGLTEDQLKNRFNTEVNQFLIDKPTDAYSKYVAPTFLKSITDNIAKDTTLSAFDKNNKIFETAQTYGMDDAAIDKAFGKTAADAYRKEYGTQIKDFITNTLAKDEGTTFDEIASIRSAARQFGIDADEIVKYAGMNKAGVTSLFDAYDKGLASLAKGFDDAKTKAGDDTTAINAAEGNKAKTMLALQSQYKVTDEDLAKATGSTAKDVSTYLTAVKDAPKTLESLMGNNTMSGADIRAKIEELKKNPAVTGIYGVALDKFSEKAAKDYSGEYGGKNYESLNPIAVSTVLEQLKAQQAAGTAQYYQGGAKDGKKGGFGSLDAMTEDMAKNLVAAGITDIRQVGEVPVYEPAEVIGKTYNGERVVQVGDEYGTRDAIRQLDGGVDQDGNATFKYVDVPKDAKLKPLYGQVGGDGEYIPVDQSKVTKDKNGNMVIQTGTTAGNKLTGEPLSKASNYSERTTGNSWSGTFKGKGNTGYNVQFKDGNPIFYTTGASSSDMVDLAPILAMASFIPGVAPFAQAINALYAASEGNWKQAILSALPASAEIAKTLGASANTVANIGTASKVANTINAAANKDLLGTVMSGTGLASDKNLFGDSAFNPNANVLGDFSTKDLLTGASAVKALKNEDLTSLANIAAQWSGSKDAATAAKGLAVFNALKSNNPMAIAQIAQKFNLTNDVIGKAGGGLASLPGLIKNSGKDTLTDKTAFDGLNGSLVAKMLNKQPPAIRAAMLKKMTQAA